MAVAKPKTFDPRLDGADRPQMAYALVCSTREINYLADEGIVLKIGRGKFDFLESIRNYIVHLRQRIAGKESKDGKVDSNSVNTALKQSQTRMIELRIAEREGRLISIDEVAEVWSTLVTDTRGMVSSIPNRIRSSLPALTAADHVVIERIVRDVLEDMTLANPTKPPLEKVLEAAKQE